MQEHKLVYKISLPIKNREYIIWSLEEDWLKQFTAHLNAYINDTRGKRQAHQDFSLELKRIVDALPNVHKKDDFIYTQLIPLLKDKQIKDKKTDKIKLKLKPGGWRGKSFLYTLCDHGYRYFFTHQQIEQERQRLEEEYRKDFSNLEQTNERHQREIASYKEKVQYYEQKLGDLTNGAHFQEAKFIEEKQNIINTYANQREEFNNLQKENKKLKQDSLEEKNNLQAKDGEITELKKKLKAEQEAHAFAINQFQDQLAKNVAVLREKTQLQEEFDLQKKELTKFQAAFNLIANFIDKVFGTTLGGTAQDLFLERQNQVTLSDSKSELIRTVTSASEAEITEKVGKEVKAQLEKMKPMAEKLSKDLKETKAKFFKKISQKKSKETPEDETDSFAKVISSNGA